MSSKIRVMYLRDADDSPVGCLAIKLHRKKGFLEYQVSVRNPQDKIDPFTGKSVAFNKTMARRLAIGGLVENPFRVDISRDVNMNQVSLLVMADLASMPQPSKQGDIPTRAIKAAKLWLNKVSR